MAGKEKLDRWAEKLLDTGKRNNLINFRDNKTSSAEVLFPECEDVFINSQLGHVFAIFDPKLPDMDDLEAEPSGTLSDIKLNREQYKERYSSYIKGKKTLLVYGQTPNPVNAVRNIAKKAKEMQEETGVNVAYLAFGFLKWKESETSGTYFEAPLLLIHVNIITEGINDPIKMEISDDDITVNPTFNYYLQAQFGQSLPAFEDGDTLSSYYDKVASLAHKFRWEIVNKCKLGIFSFLKINMYNDLKNNAELILKNPNVLELLNENQDKSLNVSFGNGAGKTVDDPLIELHTVVDADSSQIEAVEMAKSGKSFVLQGPPGTGKSQTITNIIAECLHDGKKILFVSEKQAALNVVFDKLKKAGLADFCLELHSHKANKKAVIAELNRTLEMPKSGVSSSVQEEIRLKQEAKNKLDKYAESLHQKYDNIDLSLYQLFEHYSANRNYPEINYTISNIQTKGHEYLVNSTHLLEQYAEYTHSIGDDYRQNAWYGFIDTSISYDNRAILKADLETLSKGYSKLQTTTALIKEKYETPDLNFTDTKKWQTILKMSAESDVITPVLLSREAFNKAYPHIIQMSESSKTIIPIRDALLTEYEPAITKEVSGKDLRTKLEGQFKSKISRLFSGEYKNLIAGIKIHSKAIKKIKYNQALELASKLQELQNAEEIYYQNEAAIESCLGECYNGPDTDWEHVLSSLDVLKSCFGTETISFGSISRMSLDDFAENKSVFLSDSEQLSNESDAVNEAKQRILKQFDPEIIDLDKHSYNHCIQKINNCLAEFDKLGNWIGFKGLLDQLKDAELSDFISLVIDQKIGREQITGSYKKNFYKNWIEYIIFSVPELSSFSRIKQDQIVQEFIKKDELQYEISKLQIKAELSQQRPDLDIVAGGSAVATLRREANKKRKQMPIRKLLSETGALVQIIKPCFLMSPLSVSTFLEPEKLSFDTVIFDEASQIFPQDAIGAIYRGKQAIIVGDSRQMPPSNFFSSTKDIDDDDEEIGDINDFESILDVCSGAFTTERLAWHYRSHYEQLIAFSNMNFYNNNLVTFPSASKDHKGIGVDYYYAGGVFDRTSKTNRKEAELIVDLVFRNIDEYPDRSLGVVAFSVAQQNLIDKLLQKRRESDYSHEWFFKSDRPEPFFIKNLETVQGDERDTIIFSVAYAPDSQGRFILNFGPLNREGGERRLNVAVTRAKDNVQLVASIHYTDIDLSRSKSEGVRLLRAYLDFAQNGEEALERSLTVATEDQFDSYFEQEVCDFLRDHGFTVDTQVGCSRYRIDLGLRKPDSSNYTLAIECDGATYHSSKNARDRDILRQRILENMGWKFYRIWSTDWYRNKAVEKERLLKTASEAVKNIPQTEQTIDTSTDEKNETIAEAVQAQFETEVKGRKTEFQEYKEINALYLVSNNMRFLQSIVQILEVEAPLSEEYLLRRIVNYFGREKVTNVVIEQFNNKMAGCSALGVIRKNGFLYLQGHDEIKLRIPGVKREIKYICIEELADGFYTLIKQNVSATTEGLFKTMTNLLGFSRTGDAIVTRYSEAIKLLKQKDMIIEQNGLLSVK